MNSEIGDAYAKQIELATSHEFDMEEQMECTIQSFDSEYLAGIRNFLPEPDWAKHRFDEKELGEFWEPIGAGNFGSVFKVQRRDDSKFVAVKKAKDESSTDLDDELKVLGFVGKHPNVLQLLGAVYSGDCKVKLLVLEFCPLGSLMKYLRTLRQRVEAVTPTFVDVTKLIGFSQQIASGMDYLTSKKIVHRDLAARNILLFERDWVKVADFGLARATRYLAQSNTYLPIYWMPPEFLTDPDFKFDSRSDVWAFGILLWEIFSLGQEPYRRTNDYNQIVIRLDLRLWKPQLASEELNKLMFCCWKTNAKQRPSFSWLESKLKLLQDAESKQFQSPESSTVLVGSYLVGRSEPLEPLELETTEDGPSLSSSIYNFFQVRRFQVRLGVCIGLLALAIALVVAIVFLTKKKPTNIAEGILIIGGSNNESSSNMEFYSLKQPENSRLFENISLIQPRFGHVAGLLPDGSVMIAGGRSWAGFLNKRQRTWDGLLSSTERFVPGKGFMKGPYMSSIRQFAAGAILGDSFVVCGGRTPFQFLSSCESFGLESGWTAFPDMVEARSHFAMVAVDQTLFVIGGYGEGPVASLEKFSQETQKWILKLPMPSERQQHAAAVFQDRLWVCGGIDRKGGPKPLKTCLSYDLAKNQWSQEKELGKPREGFGLVVLGGSLVAVGGDDYSEKYIEVFNSDRGHWKFLSMELKRKRWFATATGIREPDRI